MDSERFERACREISLAPKERQGIGTLSEKTLHAAIKRYIEPCTEDHEVNIGKFVADVARGDELFEIQTGSFTPLRKKLETMLEFSCFESVTVVYPMAAVKYLCWVDPQTGEVSKPRRCPKKAKPADAFYELIRIKYLLDNPRVKLKLLMLELREIRLPEAKYGGHGRGSKRVDRIPAALIDEIDLDRPEDYDIFIPEGLGDEFTITNFAKSAGVYYECAQRALSVLEYLGRVKVCGKRGRMKIFSRA